MALFKKNAPGCCCGCSIFEDDFNRSDSSTIDVLHWDEDVGDWEIISNQLVVTTSNAIIRCLDDAAETAGEIMPAVSVLVTMEDVGDAARIYVDYTDEDNCIYVETVCGTCTYIVKVESGTPDILNTFPAYLAEDTQGVFQIWYGDEPTVLGTNYEPNVVAVRVGAMLTDGAIQLDGPATSATVCLGTGAVTGSVTFDNFVLRRQATEFENRTCTNGVYTCTNIFNYDFDAFADADPLPCSLEELAGSWNIYEVAFGHVDLRTSDTNAVLANNEFSPLLENNNNFSVSVQWHVSDNNALVRFIGLMTDEDNYVCAQIDTSASAGTMKIIERVAGSDSQLGPTFTFADGTFPGSTDAGGTVIVCYGDGSFSCSYIGTDPFGVTNGHVGWDIADPGGKLRIGLGTGGTLDGDFLIDSWSYSCGDGCTSACAYCEGGTYPDDGFMLSVPTGTFSAQETSDCNSGCDVTWPFDCTIYEGDFLLTPFDEHYTSVHHAAGFCSWRYCFEPTCDCTGVGGTGEKTECWVLRLIASGGNLVWMLTMSHNGGEGWTDVTYTATTTCDCEANMPLSFTPPGFAAGNWCDPNDNEITAEPA